MLPGVSKEKGFEHDDMEINYYPYDKTIKIQ